MVTNKQTNEQPGDPRASLLLTNVRRQSFATTTRGTTDRLDCGKDKVVSESEQAEYLRQKQPENWEPPGISIRFFIQSEL